MFEGNFDMDKAKTRKITLKYSTFDQAFWGGSKPILKTCYMVIVCPFPPIHACSYVLNAFVFSPCLQFIVKISVYCLPPF